MKQAIILHATDETPNGHWYQWLKKQLETHGYKVWDPLLPQADRPNARRYTDFLLGAGWDFQDNLIIGHSSGAVEILHLLQNLPDGITIKAAVLAGVFSEVLAEDPEWEKLKGLFDEPFDFNLIKSKAKQFLVVHGSNDPWCDPKQAQYVADEVGGEYVEIEGGQHFSVSLDPSYTEFPQLTKLLSERDLL